MKYAILGEYEIIYDMFCYTGNNYTFDICWQDIHNDHLYAQSCVKHE